MTPDPSAATSIQPEPPKAIHDTPRQAASPICDADGLVSRHVGAVQWISLGLIVAALLAAIACLPTAALAHRFAAWIDSLGPWGPLVFVLGYAVATLLWIPGMVMATAGGALFGIVKGSVLSSLGALIAECTAFVLTRYIARAAVERRVRAHPRFAAIDRAITRSGWRVVVLLRLTPGVPSEVLNYVLGVTGIGVVPWFLATLVATPPGVIAYAWLGAAGAKGLTAGHHAGAWEWVGMIGGLIVVGGVVAYITIIARRALARADAEFASPGQGPKRDARDGHRPPLWGSPMVWMLAAAGAWMLAATAFIFRADLSTWIGGR
ncbi:MAG: TVP38/TMEM64 family protein [Planctomycetota bacterium]|nr:TVP38/TMEM64 family protein [Planctomycetota bacterium]